MFDQFDDAVERVVRHLRGPVSIDPALDQRVMQKIAALPPPSRGVWRWLTARREVALSPLGALGIAAAIAAAFVGVWRMRVTSPPASPPDSALHGFQFVLVEPRAANVSLVGDFNDWDATRTPMHRTSRDGLWSAVVSLQPGRYRYAFLIDGRHWLADPAAPAAGDDDYGAPSSVVTVGGGGS
jgi:hypothetical protein